MTTIHEFSLQNAECGLPLPIVTRKEKEALIELLIELPIVC